MSSFSPVLLIRAQCTCREPGVVKSRAVDLPQSVHRRRKDVCELSNPWCVSLSPHVRVVLPCFPHSVSDIRAHNVLVVERVRIKHVHHYFPEISIHLAARPFLSGLPISPTTTLTVVLPSRLRSGVAWMHAGRRKGQVRHVGWLDGLGGLGCMVWTTGRVYCI
ncbi:hypothetical protein FB45DRAFT_937678 [Roridomyces roridus]|uniref:Uncharacterized protein n=1 Tax=Roridomyces roridus TaxID=1738132 RepID=A0AAD7FDL9_9AGAR|nr:hypothetical protein FB45DRAFT_937678 [Roridomyces roridus]